MREKFEEVSGKMKNMHEYISKIDQTVGKDLVRMFNQIGAVESNLETKLSNKNLKDISTTGRTSPILAIEPPQSNNEVSRIEKMLDTMVKEQQNLREIFVKKIEFNGSGEAERYHTLEPYGKQNYSASHHTSPT